VLRDLQSTRVASAYPPTASRVSLIEVGQEAQQASASAGGQTPYCQPEDWVFASPKMNGMQPYWPETLLKWYGEAMRTPRPLRS